MEVKLLWMSVLLSTPILTLCDPLFILSAPNLLRVGSPENILVEAQDYNGDALSVRISVKNFPAKNIEVFSKVVTLPKGTFQILTDIEIPADSNIFSDDEEKHFVFLQAQFPSVTLEKVILVSFQSGYMFIQTDKPIYTPSSTVRYRIFSVMPNLVSPSSETAVTVDIMNPQNITIESYQLSTSKGVKSTNFILPKLGTTGFWKIIARYTRSPKKTFTAEFEVKEYVLPTFEIKLKTSKSYYYVGSKPTTLELTIEATYLFGQKVYGNAYVIFGVMQGETKTALEHSLQKVTINDGVGTAVLTREMIEKTFKHLTELIGDSIYISVNVLTESGSEMVEAERRGIQIVTSPYTIRFERTAHFYKPGMPFDVAVLVTNPDGTPAGNVEVKITPGDSSGVTKPNGITKVKVNTPGDSRSLTITAKTNDEGLTSEQQDSKTLTAQAYQSIANSQNYLHIGIDSPEFEIGDTATVNLYTGKSPGVTNQDVTYMILSKGQIVKAGRFKREGQALVALSLPVTKDMVPSFRFVAYYNVGSNEVVSDSVWVDVKDTCMGKLQLEVKEKKDSKFFDTGKKITLQITGDPGAKVGLVVVDKAVHVLNKNRLTQTKIWDVVEKHDTGCTGGSGADNMGVFTDAGLAFESNTAGGTKTRTEAECHVPKKRKRRSAQPITTTLVGKYKGELKQCCIDGMRTNRLDYTCERRSTYILDGPECVNAFLRCCNEIKKHKYTVIEDGELILSRSDDDEEDYTDYDDITSRTQFPESWFWEEVDLCEACTTPSADKTMYTKDSITTWQILAVSLSPNHGICVAEPEEIVVFKDFFIDLKLPYSAVRGEHVEIKAIIHNYSQKKLKKVRVEFLESPDICSVASKKGKYRTTVSVDAVSSVAVSYVIIPMKLEDQNIEVKASALDYEDGIRKVLKVVSEGKLITIRNEKLELNPTKEGDKPKILKAVPQSDQVPDTPSTSYVTITGDEITESVQQAINGTFMGNLIKQPYGCGEQNMASMTLPLIATHYLDRTGQWENVGIDRRKEAINHVKTGYTNQLKFRSQEGAYAPWSKTEGSTWLTAYVAKVFAMAYELITIQEDVLCGSLKWLVLNKQLPDGSFREDMVVYDRRMMGGVDGREADASLTAFVLIAMQEGREICGGFIGSLGESMRKAVDFLRSQLPRLTNPYAVAITSFAMGNAGSFDKNILLRRSTTKQDEGRYWEVTDFHQHSIEATAYAVLALVRNKDFTEAEEAVKWLSAQQSSYGGYGTTQTTIMVFQAVAEFYTQTKDKKSFDLEVELSVPGRSKPTSWSIRRSNMHHTRSDFVDLNKDFTVTATGTGSAILSVLTVYYARSAKKPDDCQFFDLTVQMNEDSEAKEGDLKTYTFTMEFFYKNPTSNATMTILDLFIPTGFDIDENDLNKLSQGKDRYIQMYEKNKVLSERGSIIIYLNSVSNREPERLVLTMQKKFEVGMLQPGSVSIYEYYSPKARCTRYYHPEREDGSLQKLCVGELCQCAEENCSLQKKNNIVENDRLIKACEPNLDYVYKAKVVRMNLTRNADIYDMLVEKVVKEGTEEDAQGKVKPFLARPSCRESLGFDEGKSYLIMGNSLDLPELGGSLQYVLGEQTWIEYWPTDDEGKTPEYEDRYLGLTAIEDLFGRGGCLTK